MIYSMTGYGRYEVEENARKVTVEMSAINHRYCDLNVRMPRSLVHLEEVVRTLIKQKVARGKLEVNVYCHSTAKEDIEVIVNETLCESYLEGLRSLGKTFNLVDDIKLSDLMTLNDAVTIQKKTGDMESISLIVEKAIEGALEELMAMRLKEGEALKEDILNKTVTLNKLVTAVEEKSPLVVLQYKAKLEARLTTLLGEVTMDPNRMATEVAVFADKCAVDEELTRLKSHIAQLTSILQEGGVVGRKLDFLMQEINREVNTIGSKANDYEITKYVVELKNEIEKIREQVQNIE